MNEQQQNVEHEELAIRTGIQAGDGGGMLGGGGATSGGSGSGDDPSRGGGYAGSGN